MLAELLTGADAILSLVAAPCLVCGSVLERPSRGPVCAACWAAVVPITPPFCDVCGDPLPTWRTLSVPLARCARCRRRPHAVDRARAAGMYEGPLRVIVHAWKYDARRSLAKPLASLMRARADGLLDEVTAVVPVPLHWLRRSARGFDQAADLARRLDLPVCRALKRVRATRPQITLPAAMRHANVRRAFAATRAAKRLSGGIALLVDDVSTTGATLDECARELKSAGVREVRALTVARAASKPR